MNWTHISTIALASIALGGCVASTQDSDSSNDENIAESADALTVLGYASWGGADNGHADLDLGSDSNRTCFLTGIAGYFSWNYWNGHTPPGTQVEVYQSGGHWWLSYDAGYDGNVVMGHAACISTVTNRTSAVTWSETSVGSNVPPVDLGAGTSERRCFLTSVKGAIYASGNYSSDDGSGGTYVRVYKSGGTWWLGGNARVGTYGVNGAAVSGSAVCVDIPQEVAYWNYIAPNPGQRTDTMAASAGGVGCFLTGVGGPFTHADYNDGAVLVNNTSTGNWELTTKNGKAAWVDCVK